jgi:ubiquinone/menaquinone biosynthesis C-methylase UbiE
MENIIQLIRNLALSIPFTFCSSMAESCDDKVKLTNTNEGPMTYILQNDDAAIKRLDMLNEDSNPNSKAFLAQLGLKDNAHVLTLGCGIGTLERWMARELFPNGFITATDIDENLLKTAKERAVSHGIHNIEFIQMDIYNLPWSGKYDFAYSRFLIEHLQQPQEAMRKMLQALKPGGTLVLEDDDVSAFHTVPSHPGYQKAIETGMEVGRQLDVDYSIGPKLPQMLEECGAIVLQSTGLDLEIKSECRKLLRWTFEEAREKLVSNKILDDNTLDQLIAGLKEVDENEQTYKIIERLHQVHTQKPALTS